MQPIGPDNFTLGCYGRCFNTSYLLAVITDCNGLTWSFCWEKIYLLACTQIYYQATMSLIIMRSYIATYRAGNIFTRKGQLLHCAFSPKLIAIFAIQGKNKNTIAARMLYWCWQLPIFTVIGINSAKDYTVISNIPIASASINPSFIHLCRLGNKAFPKDFPLAVKKKAPAITAGCS